MPHTAEPVRHSGSFGILVVVLVFLFGAAQHLPQCGQTAQLAAVPELRVGTQHTARAHDAGGAQQLRLHFLAAGLQLCGQLFQLQQLGGTQSAVYATEVSAEEYLAYTTEETEKVEVYRLAEQLGGDIEAVIRQLAERRRKKE